ncbi:TPA: hypothetical protein PX780_003709 [Vibrio cholerae]|nr:hypothetical protein [Vibrio cholerae]
MCFGKNFEGLAKEIISRELRMPVELHDNGSESGMFDLRIGSKIAPLYAIECVGAVERKAMETWNIGPGKEVLSCGSSSNWIVSITKTTNIKYLKKQLPEVICLLESLKFVGNIYVDSYLELAHEGLFNRLHKLGITSVDKCKDSGDGKIYLTMDCENGGPINQNGNALAEWVGDFLRASPNSDVIKKLVNSGAQKKHVFIKIVSDHVPWDIESYFYGEMLNPSISPILPAPVDGVWIILNGKGIKYVDHNWCVFEYKNA